MQGKYLYEYATIRFVPKVEREEFLNVGTILFCKKQQFINVLYTIDEKRITAFCGETDLELLEKNLEAFQKIAWGKTNGGPLAKLDMTSRFRWLTAVRSSVIQTSRPHGGFSGDLERTAQRLFTEMVL
ncbi:MAG: DUF3037 domain-containing protein [Sediminicola sp.]